MTSREKGETATVVISTLGKMSPYELKDFYTAMLDFVTLTEQAKIEVQSSLRGKLTKF